MLVMAIGSHKVLAGQIEKVTANVNDSGQVTIKGNISGGKGKVVNVKVVDDKGILNYADTTISGNNGTFLFTYQLPENGYGDFHVMVNSSDTSEPIVTNFSYGTENRLSSLDTNLGTIMPDFSPDISEYKLIMKNNKTRIRFLPVSMGKVSAIEINGEARNVK